MEAPRYEGSGWSLLAVQTAVASSLLRLEFSVQVTRLKLILLKKESSKFTKNPYMGVRKYIIFIP